MPTIEEQIYKRGLGRGATRAEYIDAALELVVDIAASARLPDSDPDAILRAVAEIADNALDRV